MGSEVARTLRTFARSIHARRQNPRDALFQQRSIAEIEASFSRIATPGSEIEISVHARAFYYGDEAVLEDDPVPHAFYRDGIRQLVFLAGIHSFEIDALIEASALGLTRSRIGDDIGALLWRAELMHVRYLIVEPSPSDAEELEAAAELERDLTQILRAVAADTSGRRNRRPNPPVPAYAKELLQEVESDAPRNMVVRAIDAALDALAGNLSDADNARAIDALLRIYDSALAAHDLELAVHLVSGVQLLSRARTRPLMQARATRWMDRATSELEKYLKQTEDDLALAAIQALLQIRTQRTVEILKAACSSKKRRVAEAARDALLKLKGAQR